MTASPRVTRIMAWHSPVPGSDWHVGRILAASLALPAPGEREWQDGALCAETDPEAFFIEKGGSSRTAKRICARCPVAAECLEYALRTFEREGVWGGLTATERLAELAAREPGIPRCASGWHPLAGDNLTDDGGCRACGEVRSARTVQAHQETRELAA